MPYMPEMVSCGVKSSDYRNKKIDICQICLNDTLPFQTLLNDEFESNGNESNLSERDMDRLNQLKFNPFKFNSDIALSCESNANLDDSSFHKFKYSKANLLCFSLSISYLWQSNMEQYVQNANSKIYENPKENSSTNDISVIHFPH